MLTLRLLVASVAILGGIALVVLTGRVGEKAVSAKAELPASS
jgi:hypothetical protein